MTGGWHGSLRLREKSGRETHLAEIRAEFPLLQLPNPMVIRADLGLMSVKLPPAHGLPQFAVECCEPTRAKELTRFLAHLHKTGRVSEVRISSSVTVYIVPSPTGAGAVCCCRGLPEGAGAADEPAATPGECLPGVAKGRQDQLEVAKQTQGELKTKESQMAFKLKDVQNTQVEVVREPKARTQEQHAPSAHMPPKVSPGGSEAPAAAMSAREAAALLGITIVAEDKPTAKETTITTPSVAPAVPSPGAQAQCSSQKRKRDACPLPAAEPAALITELKQPSDGAPEELPQSAESLEKELKVAEAAKAKLGKALVLLRKKAVRLEEENACLQKNTLALFEHTQKKLQQIRERTSVARGQLTTGSTKFL
eukprot:TRINITY_DN16264_c0_g1_i3.p1 TRINITY_DN16264_c0_g1~~TRINITY_DN16264_c0_g1_i3.p1  ORF type:complete len:367 (-),score=101.40 TRINITY_DN16264_c0_g1_i3:61-1161(-)